MDAKIYRDQEASLKYDVINEIFKAVTGDSKGLYRDNKGLYRDNKEDVMAYIVINEGKLEVYTYEAGPSKMIYLPVEDFSVNELISILEVI